MAIAKDRLSVSSIKDSVKASTTSGSNSNPLDFQSISDKVGSTSNSVSSVSNGIEGKINSALSGVSSTVGSILDKGLPKNLSFNTNKLGFFENILCGKLPDLNLRLKLPKIKADFNFDLKFGIDVTICGNSKKVNPVDAAFSVVNAIKDPQGFLDAQKEKLVNSMLDKGGAKLLDKLGMSKLTDCIRDSVKTNLNDAFGENGLTLREKLAMFDATTTPDCTGDLLQDIQNQANIQNRIAGAIFGKVSSLPDWTLVGQIIDKIIVDNKPWGIGGIGDMIKWPTYNSNPDTSNYLSNQLKAIHGIFGEKHAAGKIISMQEGYDAQGLNRISYSQAEMIAAQAKGEYILDRLAKENVSTQSANSGDNTQFDAFLVSLNILDPSWTKDSEGNTNLYRAQDNNLMNTLSKNYISSRDKSFDLTGNVVTKLDMGDHIAKIYKCFS